MIFRRSTLVFTLFIFSIATGDHADARDLFVNNATGSDSQNGQAADSQGGKHGPVRTISRGLQLAKKGATIHVANNGTMYRESLSIQNGHNSGLVGRSFRIIGNGAILDGRQKITYDQWTSVGNHIYEFKPPRSSFFILFVDNQPGIQVEVSPTANKIPALEELQWCVFKRKIYFKPANHRLPDSHDVTYTHASVGITLINCQNVVIENLIVQGFQLDGINAHDNVFGAQLKDITAQGNGRSGISVGGASRVRIEDCLVGNNGKAQIRTEGHSLTTLKNNDLIDTDPDAPAIVNRGGQVIREE